MRPLPPRGPHPHPPGKWPAELGVHTSTCASEIPQDPHLHPGWPGDQIPLNPGPHTSRGRTLRERVGRSSRRCSRTSPCAHLPSPFTSSLLPFLPPKLWLRSPGISSASVRPPTLHRARAPFGLCGNCPAQRCLTPGKPEGARELTVYCCSVRTSCERGRRCAGSRLVEFSFLVTARALHRPRGSVQQGRQPAAPRPPSTAAFFLTVLVLLLRCFRTSVYFFQRRLLPPGKRNLFLTLRLTYVRGSAPGDGQHFCLKKCLSLEHQESLGGRASSGLSQRQ